MSNKGRRSRNPLVRLDRSISKEHSGLCARSSYILTLGSRKIRVIPLTWIVGWGKRVISWPLVGHIHLSSSVDS